MTHADSQPGVLIQRRALRGRVDQSDVNLVLLSARLHEASFSCHFCTFLWSPDSLDVWKHSLIQSQKKKTD